MTKQFDAVYKNGAFVPLTPLEGIFEGDKITVIIHKVAQLAPEPEEKKVVADPSVTLEDVRRILAKVPGSLADAVIEDREERF